MRVPFSFLVFLITILITTTLQAQNQQNIAHKVQSKAFETERTIKVFLPERYFRDSTSSYIVVYVLDAHDDQVWNMATGVIDYMVSRYTLIPMIVVGIASENRGNEFNPNSSKLHQHFEEDVFPLIESKYRTLAHRTIVGHSWGGAFVGNTLFGDKSKMFDAYLGISPSFGANDGVIYNQADSLFQLKKDFRKFLYFSAGSVGFEEEYKNEIFKMDSTLTARSPINLAWKIKLFEGKDHFSGLIPGLNDGLVKMSRNYFADQKIMEDFAANSSRSIADQIASFNKTAKEKFGFVFTPSTPYYRFTGNEFRDKEQYEAAIEIYNLGLKGDPDDVKINFNVADTYDKMRKYELAEKKFKHSLQLLEQQKEKFSENYNKNITEWATKKLEGYKK